MWFQTNIHQLHVKYADFETKNGEQLYYTRRFNVTSKIIL